MRKGIIIFVSLAVLLTVLGITLTGEVTRDEPQVDVPGQGILPSVTLRLPAHRPERKKAA